jgi:RNA polymerase sigma factor (TIGR02999 family)
MPPPRPADDLFPLVYDELRVLAAAQLAGERAGHTLEATALVHEAYLRLAEPGRFETRGHFFAAAAEAMRRILVDHARARHADKRGGGARRVELDADGLPAAEAGLDVLALDESLKKLAAADPEAAALVNLRYFAGLTIPQAAEALGISPRSADRLWAFAKAWLYRELTGDGQS